MRSLIHPITGGLLPALVLVFAVHTATAQDAIRVAPKNYKVLLDNNRVRVLDLQLKPGEKIGMHSRPAAVSYYLEDCQIKVIYPDRKTTQLNRRAGQTFWGEPGVSAAENVGRTNVHAIVVEIKEPARRPPVRRGVTPGTSSGPF
jgi:hypothetical protein